MFLLLLAFSGTQLRAQTLFTYGKNSVSKEEFLRAYNKNNTGTGNSEKAYRDYLDLYVKFKLKVAAGYAARLDTLPSQKSELQNFRNQIADGFMNDDQSMQLLVEEAFRRSQKDLRLSYLYFPFKNDDTATAFQQSREAWQQLKGGASLGSDIGYITVFTLPYDLENIAYNTPKGGFSAPTRIKNAYTILRVTDERPAAGRMRAGQILLAFRPDATDEDKAKQGQLADSIYNALQKGAAFKDMVSKYSNDNISYQAGGLMPEFGVGKYDPAFEAAAFALAKDGDISRPVRTNFGYHIIQRVQRIPVNTDKNNVEAMAQLKQFVQADPRVQESRRIMVRRMLQSTGYKKGAYNDKLLWSYADSVWMGRKAPQSPAFGDKTVLFSFTGQNITAADFGKYLRDVRNVVDLTRNKTMPQIFDQFVEASATQYYRNHLEQYNKEFAAQLKEFKEGNLLFEVMQRQVWDKAASDSVGLKNYYAANKGKYWWEPSADVILFTCSDSNSAMNTKAAFEKNKAGWRAIVQNSDATAQADSGRFELAQLPAAVSSHAQAGYLSGPAKSATDNSYSFAYVLNVYQQRSPRNFDDARGFVINDYQNFLEGKWIETLRKKYPVAINEAVFKTLVK
ncbi:MAG: peptidylprolyl isomerase [Bacteroidetes bacterium]|nr:peptidylprolyl isomerase [Bacteroidota bacterium]